MTTINRQKAGEFKLLGLFVIAVLILTACGGDDGAGSEGSGGDSGGDSDILYIAMTNAPDSFNAFNAPGVAGRWVQRYFYDSLLTQPEALVFEAGLAEPFESEDNQNWTINLNPDAAWTDGEPITAEDVVFTLNTIAHPDTETTFGVTISMLEGVDDTGKLPEGETEIPNLVAVDEHTVTFTTKEPVDPNYLYENLGFNVLIVPEHIVSEIEPADIANSEFALNPTVFSGPYTFVEYQDNAHVELAANPDYYKGAPEIESIFLRIMTGTNLVTEFQSGGVQMNAAGGIGIVPIQDIVTLEGNDDLVIESSVSFGGQFMMINNERFTDSTVRQAFAYAIDFDLIVDDLLQGEGEVIASPYNSASPYRDEDLEPLPYDPDLAQQMLEEAGFDFSQEINLVVPTGNVVREQSANLIEHDLESIGLNVTQTNYDFPTALETAGEGDYDLLMIGFSFNVDPDLSSYFSSNGASNYGRLNSPELDELLAEGQALTSFEERESVYHEIQQFMQDEMFIVPLYSSNDFAVRTSNFNGGIKNFWSGSLYDLNEWSFTGAE